MIPSDDDIRLFYVDIAGPQDSMYEGGTFRLQMYVPADYPFKPPKCLMRTKIYHVNFDPLGKCLLSYWCLWLWSSDWQNNVTILIYGPIGRICLNILKVKDELKGQDLDINQESAEDLNKVRGWNPALRLKAVSQTIIHFWTRVYSGNQAYW